MSGDAVLPSSGVEQTVGALVSQVAVLLVIALLMSPNPVALAQESDASAVAGSWTVRSFTPSQTISGPDAATCWPAPAVGDTVTVTQAGDDDLDLTVALGQSWSLEPNPTEDPDPAVLARWRATDEDVLTRFRSASLDFTGGLIYVDLEYGRNSSASYCTADLVAGTENAPGEPGAPGEPARSLGVTLACQHNFSDAGRVECTATATQQADDASIEYDWTFDGVGQTGVTGDHLTLNDVRPGDHTVAVVARDTVNSLTSSPETVSFTKSAGGDGGLPLLPIGIAVGVLLAGAATFAGRRRRPGPATVPPLGSPTDSPASSPAGVPRPTLPPETVSRAPRRPLKPPETVTPRGPPRVVLPPDHPSPHKPLTSEPATATLAAPRDKRADRRRTKDRLWLEADPSAVSVRGNARDETAVQVRAFWLTDGVPRDASGDVIVNVSVSDPSKIRIRRLPGYCNFAVRGTHVGSTPFRGTVTVEGTTIAGERPRPAVVQVTVLPTKWEVKISARKKGFHEGEIIVTLPHGCAKVRGRVECAHDGGGPVVHARCLASMRVNDGYWTSPRGAETDKSGAFWFAVPQDLVAIAGVEVPDYDVPRVIELGLNAEVKESLHFYHVALDDFRNELGKPLPRDEPDPQKRLRQRQGPGGRYMAVMGDCGRYPAQFVDQLREQEEFLYNRLIGALQLLRASIMFSRLHRDDFKDQRAMISLAARDAFVRVFDVFTDFLPVAMASINWAVGKQGIPETILKWIPKAILKRLPEDHSLPGLILSAAKRLVKLWGGKLLLKAVLWAFYLVRGALIKVLKLLSSLFHTLVDWAREAGLRATHLDEFTRRMEAEVGHPELDQLLGDRGDLEWQIANAVAGVVVRVSMLAATFLWGTIFLFLSIAALMTKVAGVAIGAAVRQFGYSGAANTWGEMVEEPLGEWATAAYDSVGTYINKMLEMLLEMLGTAGRGHEGLKQQAAGVNKNSAHDLCELIMDHVKTLRDMDERCAPALEAAYARSVDLRVSEEWRAALARAVRQETEMQTYWREFYTKDAGDYGSVQYAEQVDRWLKVVTRIVQAFCFSAAVFGAGVAKLLKAASASATKVAGQEEKVEGFNEFAGEFEKLMDVTSLIFIKAPIFGLEMVHLFRILALSPERIEGLYE